ncbi:hypothetical protein FACS18949_14280 [Clostridia bacterium]|nr:hypothetical protein FACS189425_07090 [Clostridia bacterium]GHV35740.1 hypothetical protein FACS18949_14280 [Clostridia bacterium]
MAYTYVPLGTHKDEYLKSTNPADYNAVKDFGKQWSAANAAGDKAGMEAAHQGAEAIRSKYAYSGGTDGSQLLASATPPKTTSGGYSYDALPDYLSKYQGTLDSLMEAIANRKEFSYDAETDPSYQAYRTQYTNLGQSAMRDTLGNPTSITKTNTDIVNITATVFCSTKLPGYDDERIFFSREHSYIYNSGDGGAIPNFLCGLRPLGSWIFFGEARGGDAAGAGAEIGSTITFNASARTASVVMTRVSFEQWNNPNGVKCLAIGRTWAARP